LGVLLPFLTWWIGPLPPGIVGAVFPALAEILLREDDVAVLGVLAQLIELRIVGTTDSKRFNLPWIRSNFSMVRIRFIRVNFRTSSDGKSGLAILMLIIERSLLPTTEESQRILAGPLIADLIQKVISPNLITPLTYRQAEKFNLIYQCY
jgi:hypothetical protein